MLHCHMEDHQVDGMAMVFQEGEVSEMPNLPDNFKKCGNIPYSWEALEAASGQLQIGKWLGASEVPRLLIWGLKRAVEY